jgi:RNA polymerase sigma factor (sigma-70 family)
MGSGALTDENLIERLRGGDLAAFDVLYARYETRLFGTIRRMVADESAAEDIFQDVFFKVLRDRSFDPRRGRFSAWVFTVARNRILQERRKHQRRDARKHLIAEPVQVPESTPEEALERVTKVRRAMGQLDEPQQQLLLLKQVGNLSYREIGEILGVAEGTIKSRLHAAMNAFRRCLGEPGRVDDGNAPEPDAVEGGST